MTDTSSAQLSAADLDELEGYLRDRSPFAYYQRITMAFSMARDALALRREYERLHLAAHYVADGIGDIPDEEQPTWATERYACIPVSLIDRLEAVLAAGRATAGTKEGQ